MTAEEAFDRYVAVLNQRLESPLNAGLEDLRTQVDALTLQDLQQNPQMAQDFLDQIASAAAGDPIGACDYQVGGANFCLDGVTLTECNGLNGNFRPGGECLLPHWPH
jgi:hypothetical protein